MWWVVTSADGRQDRGGRVDHSAGRGGGEPVTGTLSNFYYLVTSARGDADTRDFIVDLVRFVAVAPADTAALRYAASLPMTDFEDAMQVAAARACGARNIVTRNVRDFTRSPIPAMTPAEALAELF